MLRYMNGDITKVTNGIIAHGCNCIGVMGAGVAHSLARTYPEITAVYSELCRDKEADELLGTVDFVQINPDLIVANCFTQASIGSTPGAPAADVQAIAQSLEVCLQKASKIGKNVYIPMIGSLRGGLDWKTDVLPVCRRLALEYDELTNDVDLIVVIYTN